MKSSVVYKIPIKLIRYCSKNLLALVLSIAFVIPIKASPLTFCPLEGDAACDDVCNIIGEDDQDETDISTVEDEWFASCIRVRGTLIINENTDLDNQQFIMDPGSEIVVKGGYRLTLSSSLLQAGCEYLWKGIRVEDGATLKIYFSRITGANSAVYLGNRCTLFAWYTVFENNYIGIATAMPYDLSSEPKTMNASLIFGWDFINTDKYSSL